jgi:AraC family transcriptional regulator, transcriptional activator of pobA
MERAQHIERPHKHDFYEIFIIKKGELQQSVDYQSYTLADNTLFFISKGQLHIWQTTENADEGYRLMFTEDFLLHHNFQENFFFELIYLDNIYQNPFLKLEANHTLIYSYFDALYQEYQKKDARESVLSALLFVLLSEIQYIFNQQNPMKATQLNTVLYKKFIQLLEENFTRNLSPHQYAQKLFISPRHLSRVIQNVAHQSTSQVIQNRIVLEAKRLLTFTSLNVSQIAEQLNFEDTSYFARYFKKATAFSPMEFKNNMSEKYRMKLQ